jgi:hypothetical protein
MLNVLVRNLLADKKGNLHLGLPIIEQNWKSRFLIE